MKKFLFLFLLSTSAFATMSAKITGWLPNNVMVTGIVPFNQIVTAQITVGNTSGSSVNIVSVKGIAAQTGDTSGSSLTAKSINFGKVCLTGNGGPTGSCNNIAPGTSQTNGSSLVLNLPMVFGAPSTIPPYLSSTVPVVGQFGPPGTNGSSLVFGYGGSSILSTTGTYIVDAVLQGNDGSYFTTGGSTLTIQAIVLPDAF